MSADGVREGGVALVVGRTLESARALRNSRPELDEAWVADLSSTNLQGLRIHSVYLEETVFRCSLATRSHLLRFLGRLARELVRMGADNVFWVLPASGVGPAEAVPVAHYWSRVMVRDDAAPRGDIDG